MDLGNIIYIIAVVGYFIYRAVSNKKGKEASEDDFSETLDTPRPSTFEDLLREIREAQNPQKEQRKPVIDPDEIFLPEEKIRPAAVRRSQVSTEKVDMDDEAQFYQGAYSTAFQTTTKIGENVPTGSLLKVEKFQLNKKSNRYAQILKNPQTLRESLVVSEILKPRHF